MYVYSVFMYKYIHIYIDINAFVKSYRFPVLPLRDYGNQQKKKSKK